MAITQQTLIGWQAVESSGDLKILSYVLDHLGDEELLLALEAERAGRRDKYPLRAVWNAFLSSIVLGHGTIAALIRELRRNAELRQVLGFDPMLGSNAVPPDYIFSRLLNKLLKHSEAVERIFTNLVSKLFILLPDFGKHLAVDGKAIHSVRKSDIEAGAGKKTTTDEVQIIVFTWYGFKIHCLCDVTHELPIAFVVTAANENDSPHLLPLLEKGFKDHSELEERAESVAADKGYDDGGDKKTIHEEYGIAPIIPPRDLAKGAHKPLDEKHSDTIYIAPDGEVCCRHDPFNKDVGKQFCAMQFCGYESDRDTLKFRCPAAAFGLECKNKDACRSATKDSGHGRTIRIALDEDPRLFLPVYTKSLRFEKLYNMRTGIERMFYRLDHLFGMEVPLRTMGIEKARLKVGLAFSAMIATALGWLAEERPDMIRSRLQSSAA